LIHGGDYVTAHRLDNGQELWRSGGFQSTDYNPYFRFIASPAIDDGYIVVPSAKNGPVVCIKPVDAKGNITTSAKDFHWKRSDNTPDVPSPLIHDGLVYLCRENGVLICLDATTGEEYYMERTHNARHRSSPVYADGKIYIVAYDGTVTVVKAGRKFEMLAQNKMGEIISATPAISNGTIYLRTQEALYAISISK
jgi:outer membrane protein assembly factor BamB